MFEAWLRDHLTTLGMQELSGDEIVERITDEDIDHYLGLYEEELHEQKFRKFQNLFPDEYRRVGEGEWSEYFARDLYPRHMEFFAAGKKYDERCFMAGNRVGKALPINELVLTPTGFVEMGSLKVGDVVLGGDGQPTKVCGVFPQGVREVVRVTASDGATVLCDLDHLWSVRPVSHGRTSPYAVVKARDLMAHVQAGQRWMLPERPCAQFDQAEELPVDPYLLGLLLGDGGLSTGSVLLSGVDQEIITYCEKIAPEYGCRFVFRGNCTYQFSSNLKQSGRHYNVLMNLMEGLGLRGTTSHTKRIPALYMVADAAARLALLQGLMDTDGAVGKQNGSRMFYSVNRALCEDVVSLARSLGMNASVKQKNGLYRGNHHISWVTHIAASAHSIFRLPRKTERECFAGRLMRGVVVDKIEPAGRAECVCIQVAAADGLFITRDFIVTHNTVVGGFETTCHLTGQYPAWWEGRRFRHPIRAIAAGKTNETTRDIVQNVLLGEIEWRGNRKTVDGSGMIPTDCIGRDMGLLSWKQGSADLIDMVKIRHISGGWSKLNLKSYQQGRGAFEGTAQHLIWVDEEPELDVYDEARIRTMTTNGICILTYTPLEGLTDTVLSFLPASMRPADNEQLNANDWGNWG